MIGVNQICFSKPKYKYIIANCKTCEAATVCVTNFVQIIIVTCLTELSKVLRHKNLVTLVI